MSGLLSRLVDHAAGTPAAVTPRLPGRFETGIGPLPDLSAESDAGHSSAEPTLDGSRRPSSAVPGAARAPARGRISERHDRQLPEPETTAAADRPVPAPTSSGPREAPPPRPPGPPVPTRPWPARTVEAVAAEPVPPDADVPGGVGRRRPPEAAPAPAPARPVVAALPAPPAATADSRPLRQPEPTPDVVHVSIGRVEVRATLAAPTPQHAQEPTSPSSTTRPSAAHRGQTSHLDLSAYLRGKREAR